MNEINPIMVQTLAKMTGKTEMEVIEFLEKKDSPPEGVLLQHVPDLSKPQQINAPKVELPKELEGKTVSWPVQTNKVDENAKALAPEPKVIQDEVITEEVPLDSLTSEQLDNLESENSFQGGMRVGGKVRVTWEPNVGKGKIKWVGKVGTVLQKLSDHGVSVYMVEFPAGKIPFQRINKKTGKLEKGYHTKKLQNWFDENNIEEVF